MVGAWLPSIQAATDQGTTTSSKDASTGAGP